MLAVLWLISVLHPVVCRDIVHLIYISDSRDDYLLKTAAALVIFFYFLPLINMLILQLDNFLVAYTAGHWVIFNVWVRGTHIGIYDYSF